MIVRNDAYRCHSNIELNKCLGCVCEAKEPVIDQHWWAAVVWSYRCNRDLRWRGKIVVDESEKENKALNHVSTTIPVPENVRAGRWWYETMLTDVIRILRFVRAVALKIAVASRTFSRSQGHDDSDLRNRRGLPSWSTGILGDEAWRNRMPWARLEQTKT